MSGLERRDIEGIPKEEIGKGGRDGEEGKRKCVGEGGDQEGEQEGGS